MAFEQFRQLPGLLLIHSQNSDEVTRLGNAQGEVSVGVVAAQSYHHLGQLMFQSGSNLREGTLIRHDEIWQRTCLFVKSQPR